MSEEAHYLAGGCVEPSLVAMAARVGVGEHFRKRTDAQLMARALFHAYVLVAAWQMYGKCTQI
jgi:hypothetical protein